MVPALLSRLASTVPLNVLCTLLSVACASGLQGLGLLPTLRTTVAVGGMTSAWEAPASLVLARLASLWTLVTLLALCFAQVRLHWVRPSALDAGGTSSRLLRHTPRTPGRRRC